MLGVATLVVLLGTVTSATNPIGSPQDFLFESCNPTQTTYGPGGRGVFYDSCGTCGALVADAYPPAFSGAGAVPFVVNGESTPSTGYNVWGDRGFVNYVPVDSYVDTPNKANMVNGFVFLLDSLNVTHPDQSVDIVVHAAVITDEGKRLPADTPLVTKRVRLADLVAQADAAGGVSHDYMRVYLKINEARPLPPQLGYFGGIVIPDDQPYGSIGDLVVRTSAKNETLGGFVLTADGQWRSFQSVDHDNCGWAMHFHVIVGGCDPCGVDTDDHYYHNLAEDACGVCSGDGSTCAPTGPLHPNLKCVYKFPDNDTCLSCWGYDNFGAAGLIASGAENNQMVPANTGGEEPPEEFIAGSVKCSHCSRWECGNPETPAQAWHLGVGSQITTSEIADPNDPRANICQVGCDGVLNSDTEYDVCGVCGGDGQSCLDCAGVPFGPNGENACGLCVDLTGPAADDVRNACGFCVDDPQGEEAQYQLDGCGVCALPGDETAFNKCGECCLEEGVDENDVANCSSDQLGHVDIVNGMAMCVEGCDEDNVGCDGECYSGLRERPCDGTCVHGGLYEFTFEAACGCDCVAPENQAQPDLCTTEAEPDYVSGGCSDIPRNVCVQCNPDSEDPTDVASATRFGFYPECWDDQGLIPQCTPVGPCVPVPDDITECDDSASSSRVFNTLDPNMQFDTRTWYWTPAYRVSQTIDPETSNGPMVAIYHDGGENGQAQRFFVASVFDNLNITTGVGRINNFDVAFDIKAYDGVEERPITVSVRSMDGSVPSSDPPLCIQQTTIREIVERPADGQNYTRFSFAGSECVVSEAQGDFAIAFEVDPYFSIAWDPTITQLAFRFSADVGSEQQIPKSDDFAGGWIPARFWQPESEGRGAVVGAIDMRLNMSSCEREFACTETQRGCDGRCYSLFQAENACGQCRDADAPLFNAQCGQCITADGQPGSCVGEETCTIGCDCQADGCFLPGLHTYEEGVACMRSIAEKPSVHNETARWMRAQFGHGFFSTCARMANSSSYPFGGPVDIQRQFEQEIGVSHPTYVDSYAALQRAFMSLSDCHHSLPMPEGFAATYMAPVRFFVRDDGNRQYGLLGPELVLGSLEQTDAEQMYSAFFRQANGFVGNETLGDYYGMEVMAVDGRPFISAVTDTNGSFSEVRNGSGYLSSIVDTFQDSPFLVTTYLSVRSDTLDRSGVVVVDVCSLDRTTCIDGLRLPLVGQFAQPVYSSFDLSQRSIGRPYREIGITTLAELDAFFASERQAGRRGLFEEGGTQKRRQPLILATTTLGNARERTIRSDRITETTVLSWVARQNPDHARVLFGASFPVTEKRIEYGIVSVPQELRHSISAARQNDALTSTTELLMTSSEGDEVLMIDRTRGVVTLKSTKMGLNDPIPDEEELAFVNATIDLLNEDERLRFVLDVSDNGGGRDFSFIRLLRALDVDNYVATTHFLPGYLDDIDREPKGRVLQEIDTDFQYFIDEVGQRRFGERNFNGFFLRESDSELLSVFTSNLSDPTYRALDLYPDLSPRLYSGEAYRKVVPATAVRQSNRRFRKGEITLVTSAATFSASGSVAIFASLWDPVVNIVHLHATRNDSRPIKTTQCGSTAGGNPSAFFAFPDLRGFYQTASDEGIEMPDPDVYNVFPWTVLDSFFTSNSLYVSMVNKSLESVSLRSQVDANCAIYGNVRRFDRDPVLENANLLDELYLEETAQTCGCADELRGCDGVCFSGYRTVEQCNGACVAPTDQPQPDLCTSDDPANPLFGYVSGGCSGIPVNNCVQCNPDEGEDPADVANASEFGYYPCCHDENGPVDDCVSDCQCEPVPGDVVVCDPESVLETLPFFNASDPEIDTTTYYWNDAFEFSTERDTVASCQFGLPAVDGVMRVAQPFVDSRLQQLGRPVPGNRNLVGANIFFDFANFNASDGDIPVRIAVNPMVEGSSGFAAFGFLPPVTPDHTQVLASVSTTVEEIVTALGPGATSGLYEAVFDTPLFVGGLENGFAIAVEIPNYGADIFIGENVPFLVTADSTQICVRATTSLGAEDAKSESAQIYLETAAGGGVSGYISPGPIAWGGLNADLDVELVLQDCELESPCADVPESRGCDGRCYSLFREENACGECRRGGDNTECGSCVVDPENPYNGQIGVCDDMLSPDPADRDPATCRCVPSGCEFGVRGVPTFQDEEVRVVQSTEAYRCLNSIPFVPRQRDELVRTWRLLLDTMELTDAMNEPYNEVMCDPTDLYAEMDRIAATEYASDYALHMDFVDTMHSIAECHFFPRLPVAYSSIFTGASLDIRVEPRTNRVRVAFEDELSFGPFFEGNILQLFPEAPMVADWSGWTVETVNGVPAADFINEIGQWSGVSRRPRGLGTDRQLYFGQTFVDVSTAGIRLAVDPAFRDIGGFQTRLRNPGNETQVADVFWPSVAYLNVPSELDYSVPGTLLAAIQRNIMSGPGTRVGARHDNSSVVLPSQDDRRSPRVFFDWLDNTTNMTDHVGFLPAENQDALVAEVGEEYPGYGCLARDGIVPLITLSDNAAAEEARRRHSLDLMPSNATQDVEAFVRFTTPSLDNDLQTDRARLFLRGRSPYKVVHRHEPADVPAAAAARRDAMRDGVAAAVAAEPGGLHSRQFMQETTESELNGYFGDIEFETLFSNGQFQYSYDADKNVAMLHVASFDTDIPSALTVTTDGLLHTEANNATFVLSVLGNIGGVSSLPYYIIGRMMNESDFTETVLQGGNGVYPPLNVTRYPRFDTPFFYPQDGFVDVVKPASSWDVSSDVLRDIFNRPTVSLFYPNGTTYPDGTFITDDPSYWTPLTWANRTYNYATNRYSYAEPFGPEDLDLNLPRLSQRLPFNRTILLVDSQSASASANLARLWEVNGIGPVVYATMHQTPDGNFDTDRTSTGYCGGAGTGPEAHMRLLEYYACATNGTENVLSEYRSFYPFTMQTFLYERGRTDARLAVPDNAAISFVQFKPTCMVHLEQSEFLSRQVPELAGGRSRQEYVLNSLWSESPVSDCPAEWCPDEVRDCNGVCNGPGRTHPLCGDRCVPLWELPTPDLCTTTGDGGLLNNYVSGGCSDIPRNDCIQCNPDEGEDPQDKATASQFGYYPCGLEAGLAGNCTCAPVPSDDIDCGLLVCEDPQASTAPIWVDSERDSYDDSPFSWTPAFTIVRDQDVAAGGGGCVMGARNIDGGFGVAQRIPPSRMPAVGQTITGVEVGFELLVFNPDASVTAYDPDMPIMLEVRPPRPATNGLYDIPNDAVEPIFQKSVRISDIVAAPDGSVDRKWLEFDDGGGYFTVTEEMAIEGIFVSMSIPVYDQPGGPFWADAPWSPDQTQFCVRTATDVTGDPSNALYRTRWYDEAGQGDDWVSVIQFFYQGDDNAVDLDIALTIGADCGRDLASTALPVWPLDDIDAPSGNRFYTGQGTERSSNRADNFGGHTWGVPNGRFTRGVSFGLDVAALAAANVTTDRDFLFVSSVAWGVEYFNYNPDDIDFEMSISLRPTSAVPNSNEQRVPNPAARELAYGEVLQRMSEVVLTADNKWRVDFPEPVIVPTPVEGDPRSAVQLVYETTDDFPLYVSVQEFPEDRTQVWFRVADEDSSNMFQPAQYAVNFDGVPEQQWFDLLFLEPFLQHSVPDIAVEFTDCTFITPCGFRDRGCDGLCFSVTDVACNGCRPPAAQGAVDFCDQCTGGDTGLPVDACVPCCADPLGADPTSPACVVPGVFDVVGGQPDACVPDPCVGLNNGPITAAQLTDCLMVEPFNDFLFDRNVRWLETQLSLGSSPLTEVLKTPGNPYFPGTGYDVVAALAELRERPAEAFGNSMFRAYQEIQRVWTAMGEGHAFYSPLRLTYRAAALGRLQSHDAHTGNAADDQTFTLESLGDATQPDCAYCFFETFFSDDYQTVWSAANNGSSSAVPADARYSDYYGWRVVAVNGNSDVAAELAVINQGKYNVVQNSTVATAYSTHPSAVTPPMGTTSLDPGFGDNADGYHLRLVPPAGDMADAVDVQYPLLEVQLTSLPGSYTNFRQFFLSELYGGVASNLDELEAFITSLENDGFKGARQVIAGPLRVPFNDIDADGDGFGDIEDRRRDLPLPIATATTPAARELQESVAGMTANLATAGEKADARTILDPVDQFLVDVLAKQAATDRKSATPTTATSLSSGVEALVGRKNLKKVTTGRVDSATVADIRSHMASMAASSKNAAKRQQPVDGDEPRSVEIIVEADGPRCGLYVDHVNEVVWVRLLSSGGLNGYEQEVHDDNGATIATAVDLWTDTYPAYKVGIDVSQDRGGLRLTTSHIFDAIDANNTMRNIYSPNFADFQADPISSSYLVRETPLHDWTARAIDVQTGTFRSSRSLLFEGEVTRLVNGTKAIVRHEPIEQGIYGDQPTADSVNATYWGPYNIVGAEFTRASWPVLRTDRRRFVRGEVFYVISPGSFSSPIVASSAVHQWGLPVIVHLGGWKAADAIAEANGAEAPLVGGGLGGSAARTLSLAVRPTNSLSDYHIDMLSLYTADRVFNLSLPEPEKNDVWAWLLTDLIGVNYEAAFVPRAGDGKLVSAGMEGHTRTRCILYGNAETGHRAYAEAIAEVGDELFGVAEVRQRCEVAPDADLCGRITGGSTGRPVNDCVVCNPDAGADPADVASASQRGYYPCDDSESCACVPVSPETVTCPEPPQPSTEIIPNPVRPNDTAPFFWRTFFWPVAEEQNSVTTDLAQSDGGPLNGFPNWELTTGLSTLYHSDFFADIPVIANATDERPNAVRLVGVRLGVDATVVADDGSDVPVYISAGTARPITPATLGQDLIFGNVTALPHQSSGAVVSVKTSVREIAASAPDPVDDRHVFMFDSPGEVVLGDAGFSVTVDTDPYGSVLGNFTYDQTQIWVRASSSDTEGRLTRLLIREVLGFPVVTYTTAQQNPWGGLRADLDIVLILEVCDFDRGCELVEVGCDGRCHSAASIDRCGECKTPNEETRNECVECFTDDDDVGVFDDDSSQCVSDPCAIGAVTMLDAQIACVRQVPYNRREHERTVLAQVSAIDTVDIDPLLRTRGHTSPLLNFENVDLRANLLATLDRTDYQYDYEMRIAIDQAINANGDCHHEYISPPLYGFSWGLPLAMRLRTRQVASAFSSSSKQQYVVLDNALNDTLDSVFALDEYALFAGIDFDPVEYLGWEVVSLEGNSDVLHFLAELGQATATQNTDSTHVSYFMALGGGLGQSTTRFLSTLEQWETVEMTLRHPTNDSHTIDLSWPSVAVRLDGPVASTRTAKELMLDTFTASFGVRSMDEAVDFYDRNAFALMDDVPYRAVCSAGAPRVQGIFDAAGSSAAAIDRVTTKRQALLSPSAAAATHSEFMPDLPFSRPFVDACRSTEDGEVRYQQLKQSMKAERRRRSHTRDTVDDEETVDEYLCQMLYSSVDELWTYWYCPDFNTAVLRVSRWLSDSTPANLGQFIMQVLSHRRIYDPIMIADQNGNTGGFSENAFVIWGMLAANAPGRDDYFGTANIPAYDPRNGVIFEHNYLIVQDDDYLEARARGQQNGFFSESFDFYNEEVGLISGNETLTNWPRVNATYTNGVTGVQESALYLDRFFFGIKPERQSLARTFFIDNEPNIFNVSSPQPTPRDRLFLVTSGYSFSASGWVANEFFGSNIGTMVGLYQDERLSPIHTARCPLSNSGGDHNAEIFDNYCTLSLEEQRARGRQSLVPRRLQPLPGVGDDHRVPFAYYATAEAVPIPGTPTDINGTNPLLYVPADCSVHGNVLSPYVVDTNAYIDSLVTSIFNPEASNCACPPGAASSGLCAARLPDGNTCSYNFQCNSLHCVEGYCCNSNCAVPGYTCSAPDSEGVCIVTGPDDEKLPLGADCADADECASGHCAGGVCCSSACDGQCESCDIEGSVGTCAPVADDLWCDDGVFCNGADYCLAGECVGHLGEVMCPEGQVCDAEADACVPDDMQGEDDDDDDDGLSTGAIVAIIAGSAAALVGIVVLVACVASRERREPRERREMRVVNDDQTGLLDGSRRGTDIALMQRLRQRARSNYM